MALLWVLAVVLLVGWAPGLAEAAGKLTLGTASSGGTFFVYGQAWAAIAGEAIEREIEVRETQGPNQNIVLMAAGQIDLGMTTMGVALQAWTGQGAWTQGRQYREIRALFPMYDTPFQLVTLATSAIARVADLAGARIGLGPRAGTAGTYYPLIFEALGIQPALVEFGGASEMADRLAAGSVDVFAFAAGTPVAAFEEVEARRPVRFFAFTQAQIDLLTRRFPELSATVVPRRTYATQTDDQPTVGVFNFAIAHRDLDDGLVYGIVKAVMENEPRLVARHPAAAETRIENVGKNAFLPFHRGAVRYFRERGVAIPPELTAAP